MSLLPRQPQQKPSQNETSNFVQQMRNNVINRVKRFPDNINEIWNQVSQATNYLLFTCPHTSAIYCEFVKSQLSVIIMLHEDAFPGFGLHHIRPFCSWRMKQYCKKYDIPSTVHIVVDGIIMDLPVYLKRGHMELL